MDHAVTMRSAYERINAGDIAGFGDLVAEDFAERQGGPGLPPAEEGTLEFFRVLPAAFPRHADDRRGSDAGGDKTVARVMVTGTHKGEFMGGGAGRHAGGRAAHRHHAVQRCWPGLRALGRRGHAVADAAARRRARRPGGIIPVSHSGQPLHNAYAWKIAPGRPPGSAERTGRHPRPRTLGVPGPSEHALGSGRAPWQVGPGTHYGYPNEETKCQELSSPTPSRTLTAG